MPLVRSLRLLLAMFALLAAASPALAEDGYELWLRYRPLPAAQLAKIAPHATGIVVQTTSLAVDAAASELTRGLSGLLARPVGRTGLGQGAILLLVNRPGAQVVGLGSDGFRIRSRRIGGRQVTEISANSDTGVLYGAFAFLRLIQTGRDIAALDIRDHPTVPIRMLDHWDNLDGTVERGYSGRSLWNWGRLPTIDSRMIDYARANASVGINAVVINNVNADARVLTGPYLAKVAALATAWRAYGIRLYLAARFSAPIELGGLNTADPLDPQVKRWWAAKADEVYRAIPDFGGFLVKANAEGQPGPQAYGRSHSDGANMLAAALAPHGGTLIWRAFVYSGTATDDRATQAYREFAPLDGKFAANVIVQVKNGPVDFQPREPFHPLFGAMPRTRLGLEVQLTREYLGQGSGMVFLAPMWSEALRSRTDRPTVRAQVRDSIGAMAGVANAGSDRDWTGSQFDQANWYAFGRLAWNPDSEPRAIADEWVRMTWGNDRGLVRPVVAIMLGSRQATVDAMTPLGLAHLMASNHHYGPGPWLHDLAQPMWNPTYYHRADARGIGFDRTASGSNAVAQYAAPVARCFASLTCVPDDLLLWFHHVPWGYRMRSGQTLWSQLVTQYDEGVRTVDSTRDEWGRLAPLVDPQRHRQVASGLDRQSAESHWWRDASIAYWRSLNRLPLPRGHSAPRHALSWYEAIHFDTVPGFLAPRVDRAKQCRPNEGDKPCAP